jgi:hypothetical protein
VLKDQKEQGGDMKKAALILGFFWLLIQGCGTGGNKIQLMNTQLIQAALSGNLQGVRHALKKGAEINHF